MLKAIILTVLVYAVIVSNAILYRHYQYDQQFQSAADSCEQKALSTSTCEWKIGLLYQDYPQWYRTTWILRDIQRLAK